MSDSIKKLKHVKVRNFLKQYDDNPEYQNFVIEAVELGLIESYEVINDRLQIRWITGGMGGGSCWDTGDEDHHYSRTSDEEPEFDLLDKLIEHYYPDIRMIKYKRLVQQCVERTEEHENEYYGNYIDYGVKRLNLLKFYEFLVTEKVL